MADATKPSSWTLKVDLDGDVRRLSDWFYPADGAEPTAEAVREVACKMHEIDARDQRTVYHLFVEADGSRKELTPAALKDALSSSGDSRILRVEMKRAASEAGSTASSGESTSSFVGRTPLAQKTLDQISEVRDSVVPRVESFGKRVNEVSAVVGEKIQEAHDMAAERLGPASERVSERLAPLNRRMSDASNKLTGVVNDSFVSARTQLEPHIDGVQKRVSRSQPGLQQSLAHFQEQVKNDFESAKHDMVSAMEASASSKPTTVADGGEEQESERSSSSSAHTGTQVAATVVGALATTVLIPFRVLRLAVAATTAIISADGEDARSASIDEDSTSSTQIVSGNDTTSDACAEEAFSASADRANAADVSVDGHGGYVTAPTFLG